MTMMFVPADQIRRWLLEGKVKHKAERVSKRGQHSLNRHNAERFVSCIADLLKVSTTPFCSKVVESDMKSLAEAGLGLHSSSEATRHPT